jgi:polar amino acid transport system substrate-binding protein
MERDFVPLLLFLPGILALPIFAIVPQLGGHGVPLSLPTDASKSAKRGLNMLVVMFVAFGLAGLASLAWSRGWFVWLLLVETAVSASVYLAMRRSLATLAWESRRTWLLPLAFGLVLMPIACSKSGHEKLVVGMELNYPPFEMIDERGHPAGISVEMAQALGQFLHRNVQIENIPFDGLIPALKTGKIDLIISSMTETPQRAQSIDFSEPYLHTGLCLLVNRTAAISSIGQLDQSGYTVAVKQGTTGQLYAQSRMRHARVLVLPKEDACVLEVIQGKAQAFIYDQMSVYAHWQRNRESTVALLRPFQEENWAIGLRQGDASLKGKVNSFLRYFRAQGGFGRLGDKYLAHEKAEFQELGVPFGL